ncbi:unnamed protein product [Chironomus riparius]|uniref:Uncharacterized protein n=1 Tax=Chironomus riparius TaxID=315576 RepID=A0A9N9S0X6_9DIPT|nr:unnamed protein product [Chironomus riparius]
MTKNNTKAILSQHKISLIKYGLSSLIVIITSCAIAIIDPLERIIESQLQVRPGTYLYNVWEKPPLEVFLKVYIFNITNSEEFLNGIDKKLKVEEVGPYVYQEFLVNDNATFHENGTMSYVPKRHCVFVPERSIGDPKMDFIMAPNLVVLAASTASAKLSTYAAFGVSMLIKTMNARPIIRLTVDEFMWGYDDKLVKLANNIVPNFITFERLGILDRLFDEGHNVVSMILPEGIELLNRKKLQEEKEKHEIRMKEKRTIETEEHVEPLENSLASAMVSESVSDVEYDEDYDRFNEIPAMDLKVEEPEVIEDEKPVKDDIREYAIDMWNGSPGLKAWGYNNSDNNYPCAVLRGAYDGTLFPKRFKKDDKFFIYRKAFCRKLAIHYSHTAKLDGIEAYWFKLADNAFDDKIDDPETICYCNGEKMCPKRGLGNITPCYYNLPIAVSLPHYYNSDPTLLKEIDGLHPEKEKHESVIAMQPRLGVPIKITSRIQLNLMNGETKFNTQVKRFDHLTVPIVWIECAVERLQFSLNIILIIAFIILPIIQKLIIYILAFIGAAGIALCALKYFLFCDLPDNKKSIKYSAVFPYIKREMAKFEDKERDILQRVDSV